tara:strand:+ start:920 stop:1387 length:468 start_codon:yes stop_codon:yes gene_type:complete
MTIYDLALCHKYTGEVEQIRSVGNIASTYLEGEFLEEWRVFLVPAASDHAQILEETYYDYEAEGFLSRGKRPGDFYVWKVTKSWEVDEDALMTALRQQRDGKLYACDWTQGADSILTDEKIAEWATYRAALRDVPDNLPEEFDGLQGLNWPTQPS